MSPALIAAVVLAAAAGSLVFSTLTYSLRDLSRGRLTEFLEKRGMPEWIERTFDHLDDLIFVTAVWRLLFNTTIVLASLGWGAALFPYNSAWHYGFAGIVATVVTLFSSVIIPNAITRHGGHVVVGTMVRPINVLRIAFWPATQVMHLADALAGRAATAAGAEEPERIEQVIEQDILSAIEEGEKEGVVDEEEREMIESVIEFRDTTAGQIMTPRPDMVALELQASMEEVKRAVEESGHSRLPVYNGTLDQIVGILYARDLIRHLGLPAEKFNIRSAMRNSLYVPESKPLRDLLNDFRLQKVHIAIVLDEYGGTAGLITIEDILEELVGDISDEHEPIEPAMFKRIDDNNIEADARIYLDEFNRLSGLSLPEDAGYDTLGGFVLATLGRIPEAGTVFEHPGVKFTILSAEPHRVNRLKVELPAAPSEPTASSPAA